MKRFLYIPITIHPFFWVLAGLIGWLNSSSFVGTIIWMLVILLSVLFHELGHALTAKLFGLNPQIALVAFGGVTSYGNKNLSFGKQFFITLNGPLFGFILFLSSWYILSLNIFVNVYIVTFLQITKIVNLFWTIINLIPVQPLDGGQLLRIIFEGFFGVKGFKIALFIGTLIAFIISLFFFIKGAFLIGALFFLFAYQNFDMWRRTKNITSDDRNIKKTSLLEAGEKALKNGDRDKAKQIFEDIRKSTKEGLLYISASQYLALLLLEEKKDHEAYQLLLPIENELTDDLRVVFHSLCSKEKNYDLVAKHSSLCYKINPTMQVAINNAKAFAFLDEPKPSGGWLQTASEFEGFDLEKILHDEIFDKVKDDEIFKSFIKDI